MSRTVFAMLAIKKTMQVIDYYDYTSEILLSYKCWGSRECKEKLYSPVIYDLF